MSGGWAVLVDVRVLLLVGLLLVVLALATLVLSTAARRLDRLHRRADGARAALVEQLVRRAAATDRLARSGLLDPAASVLLAGAAAEALGVGEPARTAPVVPPPDGTAEPAGAVRLAQGRERAESDLSAALRAALPPEVLADLTSRPEAEGLLGDLATSCHRLALARRLANDAQVQVARRRRSRLVRWAHLAGRAPAPRTFEVDDEPPPGLLP
ncbi:hypothetical protein WDZ17_04645 [Pseudokineococcus basanitobsidens]|uniref:NUDIX hydrolase n=1 Tax=Pseudokineococcus basanitobsidens TaxID=1926649 RepID=A0ABU8RHR6_9ACTN